MIEEDQFKVPDCGDSDLSDDFFSQSSSEPDKEVSKLVESERVLLKISQDQTRKPIPARTKIPKPRHLLSATSINQRRSSISERDVENLFAAATESDQQTRVTSAVRPLDRVGHFARVESLRMAESYDEVNKIQSLTKSPSMQVRSFSIVSLEGDERQVPE